MKKTCFASSYLFSKLLGLSFELEPRMRYLCFAVFVFLVFSFSSAVNSPWGR